MKKITELTETRFRTVHFRNEYGELERDTEEFSGPRMVRSIKTGPRFAHLIIDGLAFELLYIFANYFFQMIAQTNSENITVSATAGLFISLSFLLSYPALYALCEYKWQKTPAKFLTKTIVIDEYGNKPGLSAIILRSLIRIVPLEPISCYGDKYSHGWHDSWSKTWVVSEKELEELKRLQLEQAEQGEGDYKPID